MKNVKLLGTMAIGGLLAANLMACAPSQAGKKTTQASVGGRNIISEVYSFAPNGQPTTEAEQMATVAETLIRPGTLESAAKLADLALARDPQNLKAQLIQKMVAPTLVLKGILKRVEPIMSAHPLRKAEYQRSLWDLRGPYLNSDAMAFLLDGQPDLQTEGQVQDVIVQHVAKLGELREWIRENRSTKGTTLTAMVPTGPLYSNCKVIESGSYGWTLEDCTADVKKVTAVANRADFEMAHVSVAAAQIFIAASTAYSLDGAFDTFARLGENDSVETKAAKFSAVKSVGILRNPEFFSMLPPRTMEVVVGLRMAKKAQSQLCPAGEFAHNSRPAHVFGRGICVSRSSDFDRTLDTVELLAKGIVARPTFMIAGKAFPTVIDSSPVIHSPVRDLRDFGPIIGDDCGNIASIGDGTLNGAFTNGDLNKILKAQAQSMCPNICLR